MATRRSYRLVYSSRALAQLESIRAYLAVRNPAAAERVLTTLRDALRRLRSVTRFSYVIVYRVSDERRSVEIAGVVHTAQGARTL